MRETIKKLGLQDKVLLYFFSSVVFCASKRSLLIIWLLGLMSKVQNKILQRQRAGVRKETKYSSSFPLIESWGRTNSAPEPSRDAGCYDNKVKTNYISIRIIDLRLRARFNLPITSR